MFQGMPELNADTVIALGTLVNESTTIEGRALMARAIAHLVKAGIKPQAAQLHAVARFVNESSSMEGRHMKLQAIHEMFQLQPVLSPAQIDNIARFVNAATDLAARRAKIGFVIDTLKTNS